MASYLKDTLKKNALLVILLVTMLIFEVLLNVEGRTSLFSAANLSNLIVQNGFIVILAIGMLMCIISGGNIDLSVGAIVILVGAVAGMLMVQQGLNPYLTILLCMIVGMLLGAWQGFWIAYVGVPAFIVTLAGMLSFRGLALIFLGGRSIGPFPAEYLNLFNSFLPTRWLGDPTASQILLTTLAVGIALCVVILVVKTLSYIRKKRKGYAVSLASFVAPILTCGAIIFLFYRLGENRGIPAVLVIIGVIALIYNYFTQNTVWGRHLFAMGGNTKAARFSGINTKRLLFFAYVNNGLLASVAALVVVARFNQASTQAGLGFELQAIAACFIGGASAYGGVGKVSGAVIGALFMGILNMGMSLLGWDINLQNVISGLVLLAAVVFAVVSQKGGLKVMLKELFVS